MCNKFAIIAATTPTVEINKTLNSIVKSEKPRSESK